MRLSQSNLKLLDSCPRKFQYLYLDQYPVPVGLEQVERMQEGSQFHQLMQQHALGLPIAPLLAADAKLATWFNAFESSRSQILQLSENEQILWQQSEHLRTIARQGHVLTVVYDWVMLGATQGQILDWKTYPKPRQAQYLEQEWQTLLYLYVSAETTHLVPDQLAMTYWFFQGAAAELQSVRIRYSRQQHSAVQQRLDQLLRQLTQWLEDYQAQRRDLPQIDRAKSLCETCPFAQRCGRSLPESAVGPAIAWDAIAEVPI
jgi:hypothetical protein